MKLKDYWSFHGNLALRGILLLYQSMIVVPASSMRQVTLERSIIAITGYRECRMLVSFSVRWLGVPRIIKNFVQFCPVCQKTTLPSQNLLITTPLPSYPWDHITVDLLELKGCLHLLALYCSKFVEVRKLNSTTLTSVITNMKSLFARFGIPAEAKSNNGLNLVPMN